jgi:hypothetical protein
VGLSCALGAVHVRWWHCTGGGCRGRRVRAHYFFRLPQPVVSFLPAASEEGATGLAGALPCAFGWLGATHQKMERRQTNLRVVISFDGLAR